MLSKKMNPLFVWGGIEKNTSLRRDNHLSSLSKPCDAKWSSLRQICLSHPHTHDRLFYNIFLFKQILDK